MPTTFATFRLIATVLVVVIAVTLATPVRAEADVLMALGIGALVVAGVIIIAFLVVANVRESQRADEGRILWVASPLSVATTQTP